MARKKVRKAGGRAQAQRQAVQRQQAKRQQMQRQQMSGKQVERQQIERERAKRQQEGQRRCHGNHNADGLEHSHQQHKNGVVGDGQAKHRAIGQSLRRIEVLLHHGGRIPGALAIAGSQGILDFLPLQVIFHCLSIRGAVIEHLTVGSNPSHAVIAGIQAVKICHSHALCTPDGQRRLRAELILLHR